MKDKVYAGQMTTPVAFFENTTAKDPTGEPIETENPLGTKFVKRLDANGNEEEEGRLISLGLVRYQMRFNAELFEKGSKLFVRDFDGDYEVLGQPRLLSGRKRYMEIRCRRRG